MKPPVSSLSRKFHQDSPSTIISYILIKKKNNNLIYGKYFLLKCFTNTNKMDGQDQLQVSISYRDPLKSKVKDVGCSLNKDKFD